MKTSCNLLFYMLLLVLALPATTRAETRYVSDRLIISLRKKADLHSEIIKTLKTNAPLKILAKDKPFLKVKTADGSIGYVLNQYITTAPPKTEIIARLREENDRLKSRLTDQTKISAAAKTAQDALPQKQEEKIRGLTTAIARLKDDLLKTKKELQSADNRYNSLLEKTSAEPVNTELSSEVRQLRKNSASQKRPDMIKWFLAGSGVFLFGIILGKLSRRQKRRF